MDYKKISQIETFLIVVALGIAVDHDSYHMFLAVASAITAYFLARTFFKSKGWRFAFFVPVAIAICQLSVTVKKAVMDYGFRRVLRENPTGVLFADVLYGFRHVITTVGKVFGAFAEVIGLDKYSSIESLNYRFFTVIVMIVVMTVFMLKERLPKTAHAVR